MYGLFEEELTQAIKLLLSLQRSINERRKLARLRAYRKLGCYKVIQRGRKRRDIQKFIVFIFGELRLIKTALGRVTDLNSL